MPSRLPVRLPPALLALALLLGAPSARSAPDDGFLDTGRRFRTPVLGAEFRFLRNPATGEKALEGADGRRFPSAEAAVLEEEAGLTPLRRAVHPDLVAAVEDPDRADESLRVVLLLGEQPLHAASRVAREAVEPLLRVRMARMREILGGIGGARAEDPARELQLGHRIEEERLLLTGEERDELRALRVEVQSLSRGIRGTALAAARPRTEALQVPVVDRIAAMPGARVVARHRALNAISADLPAGRVAELLSSHHDIVRVLPRRTRRTSLNTSVSTIGASTWTSAGYDGSSTTRLAVLDTGIDSSHPSFTRADTTAVVVAESVFLDAGDDDPGFFDDAASHDDFHGHGTHVGGIAMGAHATYKGVAPGGGLMDAKCGFLIRVWSGGQWVYGGALEDADIMAAGDWAADNGADVVNASFGGAETTDGSSDLSLFFDALVDDLGISAAVAAGNEGPNSGTVGTPADAFNVVTVGSLDDNGTTTHTDNSLSGFSSRGPLEDGRRKPDLCAPGSSITSCRSDWEGATADFVAFDGTSMAAPHVAGSLALLEDYSAAWRPESMRALLMTSTRNTSPYPTSPNNDWGTGGMDLAAAYTARASVLEGTLTSSGSRVAFVRSGTLASGKRATLCWNREVLSAGDGVPTTYRAPLDLDLYVFEEADDSARGSSILELDTAEQVAMSSSSTFPILKIHRYGEFPSGQTSVGWSIATEATTASKLVTPPDLSCEFTEIPASVGTNHQFTVKVTVTNDGELPATTPAVALTLPPSYTIVSGSNPAVLTTIPAVGDTRTATWTVQSGGAASGDRTFSVKATSDSFDENFESPTVQFVQELDVVAPEGGLSIAGGADAVNTTSVSLGIVGIDDASGVDQMRFRNDGGSWTSWIGYADTYPWTLGSAEGTRTVDVQLKDAVGNLSSVLSDSIVLDSTSPSGTFQLAGGAAYVMPWEDVEAATSLDDGDGGSGVAEFHFRWGSGGWSQWLTPPGPTVTLDRPVPGGAVVASMQFRDSAANVSGAVTDAVYVVEAGSPMLTAVKRYAGNLAAGGDHDAFRIDAVAGDLLTVKVKAKPVVRGADFRGETDLFDPDDAKVVVGRFPADAKRPGLLKFPVAKTGTHWIVLRPAGADAAAGGTYSLSVKVSPPAANRRFRGAAEPTGEPATATREFAAVKSFVLRGTVRATTVGELSLLTPDGDTIPLPSVPNATGTRRKIVPLVLDGGTGTYTVVAPATGVVLFDLTLKAPAKTRVVESL